MSSSQAKKTVAAFVLTFSCILTYSQSSLEMGNRILGGGISITLSETETEMDDDWVMNSAYWGNEFSNQTNHFSVSPYYGRFFKDYVMIGIDMELRTANHDQQIRYRSGNGEVNSSSVSFGFGTLLKYYFPIHGDFGAYVQPGMGYLRTIQKNSFHHYDTLGGESYARGRNETRTNAIQMDMKMGLYYFIFDQLTIETNLAQVVMSASQGKRREEDQENGEVSKGEQRSSALNLRWANKISFDQLFTLNYYF